MLRRARVVGGGFDEDEGTGLLVCGTRPGGRCGAKRGARVEAG